MVCIPSRAASLAPHFPLVASPMSVRGFQCRIVILAQGSANWGRRSRRDFALAERIATVEFAHREAQLDSASCTGSITQDPPIVAMHGGRRESTKGTASCGMRCNDSNDQTGCGDLNLINQHPFGKWKQWGLFHHHLGSRDKEGSTSFFWKGLYHEGATCCWKQAGGMHQIAP